MTDNFRDHSQGLESPANDMIQIAPSDTLDLVTFPRALCAAAAGNVRVTTLAGTVGTVFLAAGAVFPLRVRRVWQTGTTATGLVGLL